MKDKSMSKTKLRDRDVRCALTQRLSDSFAEDPDTMIVQEFGIRHGASRVDIAVINGAIHGYEIKSEADTLTRLPHQVDIYSKVLDYASLVVSPSHIKKAIEIIPQWWGILSVEERAGEVAICKIRKAKFNRSHQMIAIAELLWRDEVIEELEKCGIKKKELRKPRSHLYERLVGKYPDKRLRKIVRTRLKERVNWRDH